MKRILGLSVSLLLPCFFGSVVGGFISPKLMDPMPLPIAILDRGTLLTSLDRDLPDLEREARIKRFNSIAQRLADAGYLVIDRGWVLAAPEDFYVDTH